MLLKQNTNRVRPVLIVLASDGTTPATGKTLVITAKKDSGSFASISPTVTERGNGWYDLSLTTAHTDTLGALCFHIESNDGLAQLRDIDDEVVVALPGEAVAGVNGNVSGNLTGNVLGSVATTGAVTGDVGGNVVGNVNGTVTLSAASILAIFRATLTESIAAKGTMPTLEQFVSMVMSRIFYERRTGGGTGLEWLKLDGTTPAMTGTLDDAANPTLLTRAS